MDAVAGGNSFGIGALFGRAWQIFRQKFCTVFGITIIPSLFILFDRSGGQVEQLLNPANSVGSEAVLGALMILGIVALLVGSLGSVWAIAAALEVITHPNEAIPVRSAYRRSFSRLFGFLLISLFTGFAVILGLVLFIIPGVVFAVWFSLSPFVYFAESVDYSEAIRKSKAYIAGHWWGVVGRYLLLAAVVILATMLTSIIGFIAAFPVFQYSPPLATTLYGLYDIVCSIALSLYSYSFSFALYEALRDLFNAKNSSSAVTSSPVVPQPSAVHPSTTAAASAMPVEKSEGAGSQSSAQPNLSSSTQSLSQSAEPSAPNQG